MRWWGGSGISWSICKAFAPCSRQIRCQYLTTQFLQAGCPSCHPTNSARALKALYCNVICNILFAVSAWTLLVWHQEEHPTAKNWVITCWHSYLSVARCKWFAYDRWCHCYPITSCSVKIQNGLAFLVLAYPSSSGIEAVKWVISYWNIQLLFDRSSETRIAVAH